MTKMQYYLTLNESTSIKDVPRVPLINLYHIENDVLNQNIWFLIWILKKCGCYPNIIRILEAPFAVVIETNSLGQIKRYIFTKNNQPHGPSKSLRIYGAVFINWKNGLKHGRAISVDINGGTREESYWQNDILTQFYRSSKINEKEIGWNNYGW